MTDRVCTILDTKYGRLLVTCASRRVLYVSTDGSTDGGTDSIVLSRVHYRLRLPLVAVDFERPDQESRHKDSAADVPALHGTEWRITREDLWHALSRKDWTHHGNSAPTESARRELVEKLIPELADWLGTQAARRLIAEGEAKDLGSVASVAREKAEACRAAAAELDSFAAAADSGADVPDAVRHAVRYGYRLEKP